MLNWDRGEGPFFGSKKPSSLFPSPYSHWGRMAALSLLGVTLILCAFQGYLAYWAPAPSALTIPRLEKTDLGSSLEEAEAWKPFLLYVEQFRRREIFKIFEKPVVGAPPAAVRTSLSELAAGLNLSGILLEKEPQAIIEDKKSGKTYFLKKGEYLNNIKIDEIKRGKVRLRYESETMELEL